MVYLDLLLQLREVRRADAVAILARAMPAIGLPRLLLAGRLQSIEGLLEGHGPILSVVVVVSHQRHLPDPRRLGDAPLPEVVVELHGRGAEGGDGLVGGLAGVEGVEETVDALPPVAGLDVMKRPARLVVANGD